MNTAEQFFEQTIPEPNSGCLLWLGSVDKDGYGLFSRVAGTNRAHRAAWMLAHGPIPRRIDGRRGCVLHTCDTPSCVNIDHLFVESDLANVQDMIAKGRQRNQVKTHCPKSHPFDEANTYNMPGGMRGCRICRRAVARAWREAHPRSCPIRGHYAPWKLKHPEALNNT